MNPKRSEKKEMIEIIIGVCSAIGAVDGWELVKYFINLKTNKRKEEAEADSLEFGVLKICFEREAYAHQSEHGYLSKRERFAWA